jgi:membrane protease YdiL (CAAX protease family)
VKRDLVALLFALLFPTALAWLEFVYLAGANSGPNSAIAWSMGLGKIVQFSFPVAYLFLTDRSQLGLPRFRPRGFSLAVGFGIVVAFATFALYFGLLRDVLRAGGTPEAIWQALIHLHCASHTGYILLALFIIVIHSGLEEYYWRWFVFSRLRHYLQLWPAIAISSLAFMAHHVIVLGAYFPERFWTLAVPFSLTVAIGGAAWAWLYDHGRSLYGVWLSHAIVDAAVLVVGYDLVAGYFS